MKENNIEQWKIPLYRIYTDDEDLQSIAKIIKRGTNWALGPEIEEFENELCSKINVDYCCVMNSGTSSLHAALLANNIQKDNEVIVPSFSFIATANSVLFVGAKPIFADIERHNFGLDPISVAEKISPKTTAIIPMDYAGASCDIFEITKIAQDNKIKVIEDAAESLGSSINGRKIGSVSETTIFSFCGNKVLTTGEGGAVATQSKEVYEKLKLIRSHGRVDTVNYFNNPDEASYLSVGYNWRISSITAALGLSQLRKLDLLISKRKNNAEYISKRIKRFPIETPDPKYGSEHTYQFYTIKLQDKKTRGELQKFLLGKSILCKVYFNPIHMTEFYKKQSESNNDSLPVTTEISEKILTLPMFPSMIQEEMDYVIDSIADFFETKT